MRLSIAALLLIAGAASAAPGDPFGGKQKGCIAPDVATAKYQTVVAKAETKAIACLLKCVVARANGKLLDDGAAQVCRRLDPKKSCRAKFLKAVRPASTIDASCPPDYGAAYRTALFDELETFFTDGNANAFPCPCAATGPPTCGGACPNGGTCASTCVQGLCLFDADNHSCCTDDDCVGNGIGESTVCACQ